MIPLHFVGCGSDEGGVKKPVEVDPGIIEFNPDSSFLIDAMPLVGVFSQEPNELENVINFYEDQQVDFQRVGNTVRTRPTEPLTATFSEYWLTDISTVPVPVYALTSCYLHYLHSAKSDPNLLGGAQPQPAEEIFILKPLPTFWSESHPGSKPVLEECAYLNVTLDEGKMKILIERSATQRYHKKVYEQRTGATLPDTPDWATEYFELFRQYPDVPIIVQGGERIALTKANSSTDSTQRISMFFALSADPPKWTDHDDDVKAFFNYYQRRNGLGGHSLIAKLLEHSVRSGTVDVIPRYDKPFGKRSKGKLITDFADLATSADPEYHPLALDPDQHPHRLIVPKLPDDGTLPIPNLTLRPDHWLTRLKVSNPLRLDLTIDRESVPAEVSISPVNFDEAEQVVEVRVTDPLLPPSQPGELTEATMKLTTAEGIVVHEIKLTFLNFHTVSVRFHKLNDTNPNHQTDMDEPRLREVIAYANEILGRQANVYIYPVEGSDPITGTNTILPTLHCPQDLGDPIRDSGFDAILNLEPIRAHARKENLHVIFVWNEQPLVANDAGGVTIYRPDLVDQSIVLVDTKDPFMTADNSFLACALVHEMGHWFSITFISYPGGLPPDERPPPCSGADIHFSHDCPKGDGDFYDNVMARAVSSAGSRSITIEQAKVFNFNADKVVAEP